MYIYFSGRTRSDILTQHVSGELPESSPETTFPSKNRVGNPKHHYKGLGRYLSIFRVARLFPWTPWIVATPKTVTTASPGSDDRNGQDAPRLDPKYPHDWWQQSPPHPCCSQNLGSWFEVGMFWGICWDQIKGDVRISGLGYNCYNPNKNTPFRISRL